MFLDLKSYIFLWITVIIVAIPIYVYLRVIKKEKDVEFKTVGGIAVVIVTFLALLSIIVYAILKSLGVIE